MPVSKLVHQVYFDNGVDVVPVSPTDELPVTGDWLTEAQYVANTQTDALTDAELRASPVPVTVGGTVAANVASDYLFSQYEATLADGAEIVSPILDMESVDKWQGEFGAGAAGLTQVIETANDAALSEFTVTSSTVINTTFQLFNVIVRQRYLRIRWQNNTGSPVSGCYAAIKASYGSSDKLSVFPLSVSPTDFSQAALVQAVAKEQQPDGDYVNRPADGNVAHVTTPLIASGSTTIGPFDTDGWKAIELYIATDQVSLQDGIVVEFTPDAGAAVPVYYPGPKFTFGADAVSSGFLVKRFAPSLDGFRITYTNGGIPQGSFFLSLELKNGVTEPTTTSIENDIDPTQSAALGRNIEFAINDSGDYGNITRGPQGGKRVSIYEHEAETPIESLNALSGNATSVGSGSATQIASAPPAGTRTITIQADPDNTKVVYFGFNASVTSGNAPGALQAGDFITFEVDSTPLFYAISGSGSQIVRWIYAGRV